VDDMVRGDVKRLENERRSYKLDRMMMDKG